MREGRSEREREKDRERERERGKKERERERETRETKAERGRERERRERPTKEFEELVYCALWLLSSVSFFAGQDSFELWNIFIGVVHGQPVAGQWLEGHS